MWGIPVFCHILHCCDICNDEGRLDDILNLLGGRGGGVYSLWGEEGIAVLMGAMHVLKLWWLGKPGHYTIFLSGMQNNYTLTLDGCLDTHSLTDWQPEDTTLLASFDRYPSAFLSTPMSIICTATNHLNQNLKWVCAWLWKVYWFHTDFTVHIKHWIDYLRKRMLCPKLQPLRYKYTTARCQEVGQKGVLIFKLKHVCTVKTQYCSINTFVDSKKNI